MSEQQVRELLLRTVEREPSLIQEAMEMSQAPHTAVSTENLMESELAAGGSGSEQALGGGRSDPASGGDGSDQAPGGGGSDPAPGGGPTRQQEPWCSCSFCREMPTGDENLCCGKQPEQCMSRLAVRFTLYIFIQPNV